MNAPQERGPVSEFCMRHGSYAERSRLLSCTPMNSHTAYDREHNVERCRQCGWRTMQCPPARGGRIRSSRSALTADPRWVRDGDWPRRVQGLREQALRPPHGFVWLTLLLVAPGNPNFVPGKRG